MNRRDASLLLAGAGALGIYVLLYGTVFLVSHLEAALNRSAVVLDRISAAPDKRPCVICGGQMQDDRSDSVVQWRRCAGCGQSVTGTPWSALAG